jgi:small ligand-binding sensory domain FIST
MSTHPDAAVATGEVVGRILERLGGAPDLSVAFISDDHLGAVANIHGALRSMLGGSLIGSTSSSIIGGAREVERSPALAIWAAQLDDATPVRFAAHDGMWDTDTDLESYVGSGEGSTLILLADPDSFTVADALQRIRAAHPKLTVVGGVAASSKGRGTTRLLFDDAIETGGAVGVVIGDDKVSAMVSQGSQPIGTPMVITAADEGHILQLAGKSPVRQLEELFDNLSDTEKELVNSSLKLGIVVDEQLPTFDRGDFVIRDVLSADVATGSITVDGVVAVGDTVQFQIRDAATAGEDLRLALWSAGGANSALMFTCDLRGQSMFADPDHDAGILHERLGIDAVAGMFCAGEIGPVSGTSFLHEFTTSIAFFE